MIFNKLTSVVNSNKKLKGFFEETIKNSRLYYLKNVKNTYNGDIPDYEFRFPADQCFLHLGDSGILVNMTDNGMRFITVEKSVRGFLFVSGIVTNINISKIGMVDPIDLDSSFLLSKERKNGKFAHSGINLKNRLDNRAIAATRIILFNIIAKTYSMKFGGCKIRNQSRTQNLSGLQNHEMFFMLESK